MSSNAPSSRPQLTQRGCSRSTTASSPPLLITGILLAAHLSFGILEGYSRTALAIADGDRRGARAGPR